MSDHWGTTPSQPVPPPPAYPPPPYAAQPYAAPPVPLAAPPSPFGAAPSPFGAPSPMTSPAPYAATTILGPPAPSGRSTAATVGIVLGAVVAGIVVLGVVAAVAIPVFLSQRDKGHDQAQARAAQQSTTIVLPATVNGWDRLGGANNDAVQEQVRAMPDGSNAEGGAYGLGSTTHAVVLAGSRSMPAEERRGFLIGAARTELSSYNVRLVTVDPGPLGGQMQCGQTATGHRTDCAFVDAGAYGIIDVAGEGSDAQQAVLTIRAAIEHRR